MDDPNRLYEVLDHFRSSLKGAMEVNVEAEARSGFQ